MHRRGLRHMLWLQRVKEWLTKRTMTMIDTKEVIVTQTQNEHQPLRFPRSERPMLAAATKFRVTPTGMSALVEFTLPGLDANATCTYSLLDSGAVEVDSGTVAAGIASRSFITTADAVGAHNGTVTCSTASYTQQFSFVAATPAGTATYTTKVSPPQGRSITHARILTGSVGGALTGETPVACTSKCALSFTAAKGVYDTQIQYCSTSNCSAVVAQSRRKQVVLR